MADRAMVVVSELYPPMFGVQIVMLSGAPRRAFDADADEVEEWFFEHAPRARGLWIWEGEWGDDGTWRPATAAEFAEFQP